MRRPPSPRWTRCEVYECVKRRKHRDPQYLTHRPIPRGQPVAEHAATFSVFCSRTHKACGFLRRLGRSTSTAHFPLDKKQWRAACRRGRDYKIAPTGSKQFEEGCSTSWKQRSACGSQKNDYKSKQIGKKIPGCHRNSTTFKTLISDQSSLFLPDFLGTQGFLPHHILFKNNTIWCVCIKWNFSISFFWWYIQYILILLDFIISQEKHWESAVHYPHMACQKCCTL